jgi:hypothetical protein
LIESLAKPNQRFEGDVIRETVGGAQCPKKDGVEWS